MKIISDQQGRILYYPSRDIPKAYLVPSYERATQISQDSENNLAYTKVLFFVVLILIYLFLDALGASKYNVTKIIFGDFFNTQESYYFTAIIITYLGYRLSERIRNNLIIQDLKKIPLCDAFNHLARSNNWSLDLIPRFLFFTYMAALSLFFVPTWLYMAYFKMSAPFDVINHTPQVLLESFILFLLCFILLKAYIINILLIYYKICQSWGKSPS